MNRLKRNDINKVVKVQLIDIYRKIYKKLTCRAKTSLILRKIDIQ